MTTVPADNPLCELLQPMQGMLRLGITEFDLIKQIQQRHQLLADAFDGSHWSLFESHFVLFNALYQLRERWRQQQLGWLQIHTLNIQLVPDVTVAFGGQSGQVAASAETALARYYLDWANLEQQTEAGVTALLAAFWRRYGEHQQSWNREQQQALALLELQPPVTETEIRRRYRQLAMRWHPDRGGSTEQIQALHQAMQILGMG